MAGNVNHSFKVTATGGSNDITGVAWTINGDQGTDINVTVPASTTNQAYPITITAADLDSIILTANGTLTIKVNSSTSPAFTWVLNADSSPILWSSEMATANPFASTNVTEFFLTNAGTTAVILRGLVCQSL